MSDHLDDCQAVLDATDYVTDEEADLLCLFPPDLESGVLLLAAQWRILFGHPEPGDTETVEHYRRQGRLGDKVASHRPRRIRRALARILRRGTLDYDRYLAELRAQGLRVVEVAGARTRGPFAVFAPRVHLRHHTAGAPTGEIGSLRTLLEGRSDLPGPLCTEALGRSNTVYLISVHGGNHAGKGGLFGYSGNGSASGTECENDGYQPWQPGAEEAQAKIAAARHRACGTDPGLTGDHKEWAPGRKPDAHTLSSARFRQLTRLFYDSPGGTGPTMSADDRAVAARLTDAADAMARTLG